MKTFFPLLLATLLSPLGGALLQAGPPTGVLKGTVTDAGSKLPLPGAHVVLTGSTVGTSTNANGEFELPNLAVGSYSLTCSSVGYEKLVKTDVIIRSARITFVSIDLESLPIQISDQTVTATYFTELQAQPLSNITFSSEEIRRAPGAAGDVSRILFALPSLAKVNDTKNSLIVRGGSPVENGFYVDNVQIPNINHFPVQGSTEGPIGIINVDLVKDVDFLSGAFPASYGNRLSSVMDIGFREGNRDATDFQLDLSMQGFGGVLEGPLDSGRGSYLVSARRSYLDLLIDLMNEQVGIPTYSDVQGKVTYDLSGRHKLSLIDVFSDDRQEMTQDNARDSKINIYPRYGYFTNTGGINWQWIWGASGVSNTSVSHTYASTKARFYQARDAKLLLDNSSVEQEYTLRNVNHWLIDSRNSLTFGVDLKESAMNYGLLYSDYQDILGQKTDSMLVDRSLKALDGGLFAEYSWRVSEHFSISPQGRIDYSTFTRETNLSPRVSITYRFDDRSSLSGTYGVYYQRIPWVIAAQKESFRHLATPRATHYVLSFNHLLTESTKLTVEGYQKDYANFPMDPTQPGLFLFDQAVIEGIFLNHASLVSGGKARSRGVELTVQKKLAQDIYGLICGSYSRSEYRGLDGRWSDRVYDNRFNIAIEGGYKPDQEWEFSLRWIYAGGAPYTPFDENASRLSQKGVFDATRINGSRLPDFHSLNIRADKRFSFRGSTLVTYLSIWNVYGRRNIAAYTWNEVENKPAEETMWGMLPVFGVEYEF